MDYLNKKCLKACVRHVFNNILMLDSLERKIQLDRFGSCLQRTASVTTGSDAPGIKRYKLVGQVHNSFLVPCARYKMPRQCFHLGPGTRFNV